MVRETRHLWVGNLPENIREDRIREHFKRYGRVQSVKLLPRSSKEETSTSEGAMACTVAFMDIKSAAKAHTSEHKIDDRTLTTEYYEPAAIPSAASPAQNNSSSTYSTSPGNNRFANSHGSTEEHTNFTDRFYDRSNNRLVEGEYIRRSAFHDSRGRNRDRGFRNGPFNNVVERHRALSTWSSYDSSRYNSETGYGTPEPNDRRSSDSQSTKKKTKSQSGSRSPSPSGSTSSCSPSRSRSRSSSCSTTSTTSRDTSSTGSPKSRRVSSSVSSVHQSALHSEDKRPLAICVKNLPQRSSDTSLKDGLFHEYKKHGKVTWVKIVGTGSDRYGIVCFKKPEDVEKALEVSYDKLFFGCKIEVAPYQGFDIDENDLRCYEADVDEYHPKATRTLFIGNLEKEITASDLRKHFDQFGEIIEIDIKKQGAVSSYAFCQYSDIVSVVKAIRALDGEHLGNNRVKLGFGKSMPTNCVWVDGVVESVTEKYLTMQFDSYGPITQVLIDRDKGQALIFYEQVVNAQAAVTKMRGVSLRGRKIQVDFASRECQETFYEHLEKQGHITDRSVFEERRDSSSRNFESNVLSSSSRFARYESSSRPRTSSYSSRSSTTGNQCNNTVTAVTSPSTPGSATPRGSGSRSRLARYPEYYDQGIGDYGDRRYRSYDEYSQGSGASHEDPYEHEYTYARESPSHLDNLDTRLSQHSELGVIPHAPPDIRNLQKERVHLLEQLEDCHSSGDELIGPRKRMKLDILDNSIASDVIIEANRDHRKVMEIRRTSDSGLKHHSRRPSIDNKHGFRDVALDRSNYVPHAVCKRRKTGGSDSSSRIHHHDLSGSESVGSSRPGTPLCDEKPEHFPSEPRRVPRERDGPLSLPLPRFAAQIMGKGSVSVAGIKGQKETVNILSSPPPAATSPRISNPIPPSPAPVPPPASPPPRPPSLSSNTSDSDVAPPSPSLDERIKSLDEKYEKWSGSRALSAAGGDALAKLDASASERFKFRHKLLDLDLKEVQPSEIVKSVMAKRSVFDEDSKRLENVGEKYEPREFNLFSRTPVSSVIQTTASTTLLSAPPSIKVPTSTQLPKTPTMLSPRSTGTSLTSSITAAKGLQYPFPTHPPTQPLLSTSVTSSSASLQVAVSSTIGRTNQTDLKLKSCVGASSNDNRTSSKVVLNRSTTSGMIVSNLTQVKLSDNINSSNNKTDINIPVSTSENAITIHSSTSEHKTVRSVTDSKSGDKITNRRDSNTSNSSSPRGEIRNRRNSESNLRKQNSNKNNDTCDNSGVTDQQKEDRMEEIVKEQNKIEREYLEKESLEREKQEKEKFEKEKEKEHIENLEKERLERERIECEKAEHERLEREKQEQLEREYKRGKEEKERKEKEELERRHREEQERLEKEKREQKEREDREKREQEERERRSREQERIEKENLEKDHKREEEKKQDNHHDKKSKEQTRYREGCNDNKHKENNLELDKNEKHAKDNRSKENQELCRKENFIDNRSHEIKREDTKCKHHIDRDVDRRKESTKENKDSNVHDKISNLINENHKENHKHLLESRHFSIEVGKMQFESHRKKDRNSITSENVGFKRRMSFQETLENTEEIKRFKISYDQNKKIPERRDSKDSKSEEKSKSKHKNNIGKIIEDKIKHEKHNNVKEVSEEKRKEKERDKEDKHKHKQQKFEKQKLKDKNRDKEFSINLKSGKEVTVKDILYRSSESKSADEFEKHRQKKDSREKRKQENIETDEHKLDESKKTDDRKKEKRSSLDGKFKEENSNSHKVEDRKIQKRDKCRKNNSSDAATDSDEPKKQHSIFDIVDDEPAYISMYDKVKARSCKNMQKQEEEKRQEKLKAKFNQLKQSRAKREEKKRSTSWDEDTDSEHEKQDRTLKIDKSRRSNKMLILSSDDEDQMGRSKLRRKRDSTAESDVDKTKQLKIDSFDTSDEDVIKNKNLQHKSIKSRITSDSSDNELKKIESKIKIEPKTEIFSDSEFDNKSFVDMEDSKTSKKCDLKYSKKEKKGKHQELCSEQVKIHIFGESPIHEIKSEDKYDDSRTFGDLSSEEGHHKKEKNELRRRHKKKQKRQKHSLSSEDSSRIEDVGDVIRDEESEKFIIYEKRKQHKVKDKKRDKTKHDEKHKDKIKKLKKQKSDTEKNELKREEKIENIFGSFSDDSEHSQREQQQQIDNLQKSLLENCFEDEKLDIPAYASDSDSAVAIEKNSIKTEEKERIREHKRKKEKKRREKEKKLNEEETNENSMDFADLGRQLENNIKDDNTNDLDESEGIKLEFEDKTESSTEIFSYVEGDETENVIKEEEKREQREKKKKRKKSKEEKHKHHHHHHKEKLKSPEVKKDPGIILENIKTQNEKFPSESPSLPNLINLESPPHQKLVDMEFSVSSKSVDSTVGSKSLSSKEKRREKLIPGFGVDIDETVHENAVKSIAEFEPPKTEPTVEIKQEEVKSEKADITEDKPRVVISQEETEDAVAALLGESFGGSNYDNSYNQDQSNLESTEQETTVTEENSAEDLEEMRQAVQSLNSADIEIKPETPQSEHELQIDTDTEEQEEISLRFDQPPGTPDMVDLTHPPKTPDVPAYCRPSEEQSKATIVIKAADLGSPPSLTPIKPNPSPAEVKRITENISDVPITTAPLAIISDVPLFSHSQSTIDNKKKEITQEDKSAAKTEEKPLLLRPASVNVLHAVVPQVQTKSVSQPRSYSTPPMVKIADPVIRQFTISPKTDTTSSKNGTEIITKVQTLPVLQQIKTTNNAISHSIPLKIQFPTTQGQQKHSPSANLTSSTSLLSPKVSSTVTFSRLPITPVMVSKPFQSTTMYLPQSLTAQTGEVKKASSVISFERSQERPAITYSNSQFSHASHPTQMVIQANVTLQRNLPPHGLLVPAKSLPSGNYSCVQTLTPSSYSPQLNSKDNISSDNSRPLTISITEPPKLVPTTFPLSHSHSLIPSSSEVVQSSPSPSLQPPQPLQPLISNAPSPKNVIPETQKTFTNVIQEMSNVISANPETSQTSTVQINSVKCAETPVITPNSIAEKSDLKKSEELEKEILSEASNCISDISKKLTINDPEDTSETKSEDMELCSSIRKEDSDKIEKDQVPLIKVTEELNMALSKECNNENNEVNNELKDNSGDKPISENNLSTKFKSDETSDMQTHEKDILDVRDTQVINDSKQKIHEEHSEVNKDEPIESDKDKSKDDVLDSKEDSDYWSAKEVNIDSVIRKVDALCSADELQDQIIDSKKDEWTKDESNPESVFKLQKDISEKQLESKSEDISYEVPNTENENQLTKENNEEKGIGMRSSRRGTRGVRGRKSRGSDRIGVQTRRNKTINENAVTRRGGRGARLKTERKVLKSESETADVYEFRDDSDESGVNKDRPRLILTIKSPAVTGMSGNTQTAIVKEVPKDAILSKPSEKHTENKDDFASPPATNTRKSRRLQERDVSRNTVDDTIEDVVKNTMVTRSAATVPPTRRSTRQTSAKSLPETPRKSPRASTRKKDRRASETTDDSSEEKSVKCEASKKEEQEATKDRTFHTEEVKKGNEEKVEISKEKPHEGLKAVVLRRIKGESEKQEPMTLIDPVTGLLTPVRECEEGRYIPVTSGQTQVQKIHNEVQSEISTSEASVVATTTTVTTTVTTTAAQQIQPQPLKTNFSKALSEPQTQTTSVITSSPSPSTIQQQKLQSLKAHVLSSQAARSVVNQSQLTSQTQKLTPTSQQISHQMFTIRASVPLNQNLTVNVSTSNLVPAHVSPRTSLPPGMVKNVHGLQAKGIHQPPPLSPTHLLVHNNQAKQQIMQKVIGKQIQLPPKTHLPGSVVVTQIVNPQLAPNLKQQQAQMIKQQVVISKAQLGKPPNMHAQQIIAGAITNPQLKEAHLANQQALAGIGGTRLVQASASIPNASAKGNMDPPKVEVSIGGCVMVSRPSSSPQGQTRHVLQAGLPVPSYEASLGEAIAHFPPGSMPLRPPHEIPAAHYMHPHVMYQQYLRQSYHLPRSPMVPGTIEKSTDSQEGEEAPITSPPLELRRPGSVGLTLTGRSATVPHSLQSPHERATDSPQVGQVYNVHSSRMHHYHPGRYYEAGEPPPAHQPLTSHSSLAALGGDRTVSHVGSLGTPDRSLNTHLASERLSHTAITASHLGGLGVSERPFTTHIADRPLPNQGLTLGAGLGAAGNLIGAVARHVGAEAPASQRGLQAATPPHASQVPPQAESLLMLLKQYPCMWQGLLALKNDQAAVQMYFVSGNEQVAKCSLPKNTDGSTPPLRIFQRMRLEPPQVEGVARKMQMENEHCMLLALPCGHDHMDVLKQSTNLTNGFITYLQQKQAAGIVNVAAPGTTQPPAYVVHIFPSCDFVNENLRRIAPSLLERVADIAHLLIVITTV